MIKKYYSITRGKRDFHQAVIKGEVFSETLIDVKPPEGFGILKMRAKDVLWFVEIESEDFELDRSNVKKNQFMKLYHCARPLESKSRIPISFPRTGIQLILRRRTL